MHFFALTRRRLTSLIATVVCAAALIPAAAVSAAGSSAAPGTTTAASASATGIPAISVNSATLVANGAAVRVQFTATCGAGDDGSVSSTTTQAVGDHVAQGTTQTGFTCTGTPQQVSALAAANVNGAPFRRGIALIQASVSDCPGANCTGASADKVLRLTK